ncbi:hypothetical protein RJO53_002821 [Enterobacter hormaechei]|nr:hypothetical protein [Enterobacter hormaechei]ELC6543158.1 hypothetical protein [Enterobacter hormaechei]
MDESRKQFEIMAAKELCLQPEMVERDRKGNGYNYKPLNLWWKIWKASRAAIEIELPESWHDEYMDHVVNYDETVKAIRAAGIKVKE